jgi:hypothetical protein
MPIKPTPCHVLHGSVTTLTDLAGHVTRVFCPEYDWTRGICRLKADGMSGGPLSQLLERMAESALDSRGDRCELW